MIDSSGAYFLNLRKLDCFSKFLFLKEIINILIDSPLWQVSSLLEKCRTNRKSSEALKPQNLFSDCTSYMVFFSKKINNKRLYIIRDLKENVLCFEYQDLPHMQRFSQKNKGKWIQNAHIWDTPYIPRKKKKKS